MKALLVVQRLEVPPERQHGWTPEPGSVGLAVHMPELEGVGEAGTRILWRNDPEARLRPVDIWDAGIKVIGEWGPGEETNLILPLLKKITEFRERLATVGSCGE